MHEIAKLILERAESFASRTEAIQSALGLGMPLQEIEAYLDWLDLERGDCCQDEDKSANHADN